MPNSKKIRNENILMETKPIDVPIIIFQISNYLPHPDELWPYQYSN